MGLCRRRLRADPALPLAETRSCIGAPTHRPDQPPISRCTWRRCIRFCGSAPPQHSRRRRSSSSAPSRAGGTARRNAPQTLRTGKKACSFRLLPLNPCAVHCSHEWCVSGRCLLAVANGGRSYVSDATTLTRVTATSSAGSADNRSSSSMHSRFSPLFLPSRRSPPVLLLLSPCSAVRAAASTN